MTTLRDRIKSNEQSGGSASLSKRTGKGRKHGRDSVSVLPPRDPIMWKHPDGKFGVHETWHPEFGGDQAAWDSALETLKVNEQTNDICQGNIGAGYFEQAKDEISVLWRLIGPYPKNWMDQGGSNPSQKG